MTRVYTGLAKKSTGFLTGIIGNRQGFLPKVTRVRSLPGVGGKLLPPGTG